MKIRCVPGAALAAVLIVFLLFIPFSAHAADPPDPADFQVILFESPGFEGGNMGFTYDNVVPDLSRWNLHTGEKWNDRISSLAVGKNARVILYQNTNFGGASISFEGDGTNDFLVADLHGMGWGDTVSSVRILQRVVPGPDEVLIFEHANYYGAMLSPNAGGDYPDLRQWTISSGRTWNDRISSLKIGKDALIYLCTDINYGGPCISFSGDGHGDKEIMSLHGTGWEDRISSMKVRARGWTPESERSGGSEETGGTGGTGETGGTGGTGDTGGSDQTGESGGTDGTGQTDDQEIIPMDEEIIFFKDTNFLGEYRIYSVGESLPDLTQLSLWDAKGTWNDKISSLKIGKNAQAYVCTRINYEGGCVQHRGDGNGVTEIGNLHGSGWGDRISSIKIREKDWDPADDAVEPQPDEVVFFEHVDYGGEHLIVRANHHQPDLTKVMMENSNKSWNDRISSFKVGSSVKVEIYEHINPGTHTQPLNTFRAGQNVPTLHGWGWGDKISAVRVLDDFQ
ncbi:MAG: beta/gamma crystallin domain-containing protein [Aminobacteriaceae bacterium]